MPLKATGTATESRTIDRWDGGFGWIAHPEETMARASHALAADDGVWVVDPVDADGVDDLLAEHGSVAGVVVLLGRHTRDAAAIARRHDVVVHHPDWMDGVADDLDAPTERFEGELADTGYRARRVVDLPFWREAALVGNGTLVIADALGTAPYYRTGDERLGVSPPLRLRPPRRRLGGLSPERILVGHGEGVLDDATAALADALAGARRRIPRLYAQNVRLFLPG